MKIKMRVRGLDEAQKGLSDLARSLGHDNFDEWANRVARRAKELCNDPDCKRIKLHLSSVNQQVRFEVADGNDKEAIDCILKSIDHYLNSMPFHLQALYQATKTELETRRQSSSSRKSRRRQK